MDKPFIPTKKRGRPGLGRPSNQELARRLNAARVELCRLRKKESAEHTAEQALLDSVPDKEERLSFEKWQALPPELFQLQLDYLDCRDLNLPLFVAGEPPEDRTARVYEAILAHDEITHEEAMQKVALWKKQREEKADRERLLPVPPQRTLPLVTEEELPAPSATPAQLETNPSGIPTPAQRFQTASEKEIAFERRRLLEHNLLNGEEL